MFDNTGLFDLSTISDLGDIGGGFILSYIPSLANLGSFTNIDSIHGPLKFSNVNEFSLSAFPNLK